MDAKQWSKSTSKDEKEAVCDLVGTSRPYISQIANGVRQPSVELSKALVEASAKVTPDRALTLGGLRPDIWGSSVATHVG